MDIIINFWHLFELSAPWLLLGLLVAGVIHVFIPKDFLSKHLGKEGFWTTVKAALIGAPMPLCSCGVIPAAIGLRRAGGSKSATTAFLVSTPETGVDSISVSYALLGPFMAVIRPIAAVCSAIVAGLLVGREQKVDDANNKKKGKVFKPSDAISMSCCAPTATVFSSTKALPENSASIQSSCCDLSSAAQVHPKAQSACCDSKAQTTSSCCDSSSAAPVHVKAESACCDSKASTTSSCCDSSSAAPVHVKAESACCDSKAATTSSCCYSSSAAPVHVKAESACCDSKVATASSCCDSSSAVQTHAKAESACCDSKAATTSSCCDSANTSSSNKTLISKLGDAVQYSSGKLLSDTMLWLLIGLFFAALIQTFVPPEFLGQWGAGILAMTVVILISIPMYICATASTPIAAGLLLAGVSPGAVLVFMLAGPATNIATIGVVARELGRRAVAAYLTGVIGVAIAFGFLTDYLVDEFGFKVEPVSAMEHEVLPAWFTLGCAVLLAGLMLRLLAQSLKSRLA
jgi:uncharacterized membrane protein YraQ (UPF0718 family)